MILRRCHFGLAPIAVFIILSAPSEALAQYVLNSGFCLSVTKYKCVEAVANAAKIAISQLKPIGGTKRIYYRASVRTYNRTPVAIAMVRDGPCYKDAVTYPEEKFRKNPSFLASMWAYVSSIGVGDILNALDIKKVEGEAGLKEAKIIDAKLNVVIVPIANGYRIYSYRDLSCAGSIKARLLNSNGDPTPGDNDTRALLLVK